MTSKKSLKINERFYKMMLRQYLKHDCYTNAFNSTRMQHENFLEQAPTLDEFITEGDTLNISLPYPISKSFSFKNDADYCTSLLQEKQIYDNKLNSFMHRYKKDKKWLTKTYVKKTKYGKLPKYMFDLSMGNIKDPDVHFNGNYNWYYTGGILDTCEMFNEEHLIYPNNENLLYVRNDRGDNYTIQVTDLDDSPIFNLRSYDEQIISVRQKHSVCVLKLLPNNGELNFKVLTIETDNSLPYIDAKYNNNKLTTLNLSRELKIQDISKHNCDKYVFKERDAERINLFGQFEYIDKSNIFYLDGTTVRIYDTRSHQEKICKIEDNWFRCDNLCSFVLCSNPDYIFLSSVHNIFKFDLRKMSIVKKWSHMLASPPLMMKLEKFHGDDLIFISGQNYEERVVLLSNVLESNLVQKVPNNLETLNECNKIYNFNLYNENEKRLKYSTAGIALQPNRKNVDLFTCNCLGDIFKSNVTRKRSVSITPLEDLNKWINSFPREPKSIMASHIREVSHVKHALAGCVNLDNLKRYTAENKKRLDLLSSENLEDIDMAAIWLTDENLRGDDLAPSSSSGDKVSKWLQQRDIQVSDEDDDIY